MKRCAWVLPNDPLFEAYHDEEWGVPVHNDRVIYEFLVLETFQAGLSWRTILHKRKNFRKAFAQFDEKKIARFTSRDVNRLMKDAGIIRNKQKILAAINNAKQFMEIQKEFGSFSTYMWSWVNKRQIVHKPKKTTDIPVHTPEAVAWSKDLKKRGFQFLGPTVVYAHMQATGMVNDHLTTCFVRTRTTKHELPRSRRGV